MSIQKHDELPDAEQLQSEYCPKASKPGLAIPGKNRGQQAFCSQSEWYIHALSLSKRPKAPPTAKEWDEVQSDQWRALYGTDEQRAAVNYKWTLPVVLVEKIEDRPFYFMEGACNELGSQEQAEKMTGAARRHERGKQHNVASLRGKHRGWLQGAVSDDEWGQTLIECCTHYLRTAWASLGDDAEDIAARSAYDLFKDFQRNRNKLLTRKFVEEVAANDAKDWLESKRSLSETNMDVAFPPTFDEDGEKLERVLPDYTHGSVLTKREMNLLNNLLNKLPQKHRTVIEMRMSGEKQKDIARILGHSARYVIMLEQQAHEMMQGAAQ